MKDWEREAKERRERASEVVERLGLKVSAKFVPYSYSRHAKGCARVGERSLNWRVVVWHLGREVMQREYSAGIAHCPSYPSGGRMTVDQAEEIEHETEAGRAAKRASGGMIYSGKPIEPDALDVLYSLVMDAEAGEHASFEDWASDLGFDTDSRRAEAAYRECLDTFTRLRAAVGDDGLRALRDAFQEW